MQSGAGIVVLKLGGVVLISVELGRYLRHLLLSILLVQGDQLACGHGTSVLELVFPAIHRRC